jgi:hypothetical protein
MGAMNTGMNQYRHPTRAVGFVMCRSVFALEHGSWAPGLADWVANPASVNDRVTWVRSDDTRAAESLRFIGSRVLDDGSFHPP